MKIMPDDMADDLPIRKKPGKAVAKRGKTEHERVYGDLTGGSAPLPGWAKQYAVWLVAKGNQKVRRTEHERMVMSVAGYFIGEHVLRKLRERQDFKEFLASVDADLVERAKQMYLHDAPRYVAMHREAAEGLLVAGKEDPALYGKIAAFTAPMLDRIAPKKEDRADRAPMVTINLGLPGSFAQRTLAKPAEDIPDVEYEILDDDPLPPAA